MIPVARLENLDLKMSIIASQSLPILQSRCFLKFARYTFILFIWKESS